jgi:GTP-binding protein EngB required for normal cell division
LETCQSINLGLAAINETVVPPVALPNIVVIGCESSGKSSVLERLASLRFFPRGEDITTRMPIRLKLKRMDESELQTFAATHQQPFARTLIRVSNIDGPMQFAFANADLEDAVGERMASFIERQNGAANGIIRQEFVIEVYSTEVTDMTLVDLPGVVTSTLGRNEPQNLPQETRNLVRDYIQDPNNLLLVIVPCSTRMNTYAMFDMIQEFNAQSRCIGVLTKADECAGNFISGQVNATAPGSIILEPHGYVAVMNGSDRSLPMTEITRREIDYFTRNVLVVQIESLGVNALVEKIVQGFRLHVQTMAPTLEEKLTAVSLRVALRLMDLGMVVTNENLNDVKLKILEKFRATIPDIKSICSVVIGENLRTTDGRFHSVEYLYKKIVSGFVDAKLKGVAEDTELPTKFIRFRQLHEALKQLLSTDLENRPLGALQSQFNFGKNLETARIHGGLTFTFISFIIGIFTDFFNACLQTSSMQELLLNLSSIDSLFAE